jgi:5-methylphenazine-1-carboxylate 1-monooxygenase
LEYAWQSRRFLADSRTLAFYCLDVADLIKRLISFLNVRQGPIERWTFGRVTLAGDAADPMYPCGSNGAAQGAIDARTLTDCLAWHNDPRAALKAYETARITATAKVVATNRDYPPDFINIRVAELVGDRPFVNLDDCISREKLRALSEECRRVARFSLFDITADQP